MEIDKIFVALFSIAGMAFTYWFFLMKKDEIVTAADSVDIIVDGGYIPNTIAIPQGKTTRISFTRKDPSSCLEEVVLGDFRIRRYLPLHKKVTVEITPKKKGEFGFSCGMNMFHGKLIVQ
jgi:plastocyanin domain-containing protein